MPSGRTGASRLLLATDFLLPAVVIFWSRQIDRALNCATMTEHSVWRVNPATARNCPEPGDFRDGLRQWRQSGSTNGRATKALHGPNGSGVCASETATRPSGTICGRTA
ncbi:hypothetical protein MTO96_019016 [Rhipicephalus appendiculatus]